MSETKMIPVIVCGGERGSCVIYGYAGSEPRPNEPVRLERARMIVQWRGCPGGLLEVATRGPGVGSVLSPPVAFTSLVALQVVAVSEAGAEALDSWT